LGNQYFNRRLNLTVIGETRPKLQVIHQVR